MNSRGQITRWPCYWWRPRRGPSLLCPPIANPPIPSCNQATHEYAWAPDGYGTSDRLGSRSGFTWVVLSGALPAQQIPQKGLPAFTFPARGDIMARAPSVRGPLLVLLLQLVLICSAQVRLTVSLSVSALSVCLYSLMWQRCRWVLFHPVNLLDWSQGKKSGVRLLSGVSFLILFFCKVVSDADEFCHQKSVPSAGSCFSVSVCLPQRIQNKSVHLFSNVFVLPV